MSCSCTTHRVKIGERFREAWGEGPHDALYIAKGWLNKPTYQIDGGPLGVGWFTEDEVIVVEALTTH